MYTLEQRWEIFRHYFENYGNVAVFVGKLHTDFGRREHSVESQKQCQHLGILLLWQKVCVKRHQHQFTIVLDY